MLNFVFTIDIACGSHQECQSQQACINGKCENPCAISNPCDRYQDCQVKDHQPVCIKGKNDRYI